MLTAARSQRSTSSTNRDAMVVLDTTFLIDFEQRDEATVDAFDGFRAAMEPVRVPAAVWVEFLYRAQPALRARAERTLDATLSFEPFDRETAQHAAKLQHELHAVGRPLAWHDLQVAATALRHDEVLVTNDKAFARVAQLRTLRHD